MVLLLALPAALAAGYHLGEIEALYGLAEPGVPGASLPVEAGFGLSMLSDAYSYTMTFGDPDLAGNGHGHTVKEWGFHRSPYGMDLAATANPFDEGRRPAKTWLLQDSWGHFGGDATTRRVLDWHSSSHLGLSIPGFFGVPARVAHLGPTAGFGLDLTWWDRWKGHAEDTVLTGKLLGEAGLVAGAQWREALYAQGRGTLHYDLFGIHQRHLQATAVAGVFLGAFSDQRWGFEVRGEADRGNDTVTTHADDRFTVQGVLFLKGRAPDAHPPEEAGDLEELLDQLRRSGEETPL